MSWYPDGTRPAGFLGRPHAGQLIAYRHAAWKVTGVNDVDPDDEDLADQDIWKPYGRVREWPHHPYELHVQHLGGWTPKEWNPGEDQQWTIGPIRPAQRHVSWHIYPHDRWPICSCCGEPTPCRAELAEQTSEAAMDKLAKKERILPGCCWSCGDPITHRQKAVYYAGPNLDLPTMGGAKFHLRRSCYSSARAYEERWITADGGRARIITRPACAGHLVIHEDSTTDCHGGRDDCWGAETGDHRSEMRCRYQSHGCPKCETGASA